MKFEYIIKNLNPSCQVKFSFTPESGWWEYDSYIQHPEKIVFRCLDIPEMTLHIAPSKLAETIIDYRECPISIPHQPRPSIPGEVSDICIDPYGTETFWFKFTGKLKDLRKHYDSDLLTNCKAHITLELP